MVMLPSTFPLSSFIAPLSTKETGHWSLPRSRSELLLTTLPLLSLVPSWPTSAFLSRPNSVAIASGKAAPMLFPVASAYSLCVLFYIIYHMYYALFV